MCGAFTKKQQSASSLRVGKAKVDVAHAGKDQFGRNLSIEDRLKLLKSGASNIVDGQEGRGFHELREKK